MIPGLDEPLPAVPTSRNGIFHLLPLSFGSLTQIVFIEALVLDMSVTGFGKNKARPKVDEASGYCQFFLCLLAFAKLSTFFKVLLAKTYNHVGMQCKPTRLGIFYGFVTAKPAIHCLAKNQAAKATGEKEALPVRIDLSLSTAAYVT